MNQIAIVGSGSWALALSKLFKNEKITIKCRNTSIIRQEFENENITLTANFSDLKHAKFIFFAIPSQTIRENLIKLKENKNIEKQIFIICSKGVEKKSNKLMSEVVNDIYPKKKLAILSGPNFSSELISEKPSAAVLSSLDRKILLQVSEILSQKKFRIYFNNDIIGTQLGGAMKNVIAIACGLIRGKNLGENAKAAIITRGMSEIVKLGITMGAKKNTFYGLSGIGDLVLTCSSLKSRNTKLGFEIAKGRKLCDLKKKMLFEGVESCESICNLGKIHEVELPLCKSVKNIINGIEANQIIDELLSRPLQFES